MSENVVYGAYKYLTCVVTCRTVHNFEAINKALLPDVPTEHEDDITDND